WNAALLQSALTLLFLLVLSDVFVLTLRSVPFTRPYRPGHAKLKTRWPLYLLGSSAFGNLLATIQAPLAHDWRLFVIILALTAAVLVALEWTIRRTGQHWSFGSDDDVEEDEVS